ncbi:hypothetical protein NE865_10360 [Phthorimaea operculella]|nr:hypothetical protein NE865_10360 [Phthorimaea operculella]
MDLHRPVDPNKTYEELTSEEKARYDHQKLHEMHKGHEQMHTTMVMILIVTLIVAQVVVVEWKKRHYKSYAFFTMCAMWSIPVLMSVKNHWWRFIVIWAIFTLLTAVVIRKSSLRPMSVTTPRLVYKWFYLIYKLSCFLGVFGYILMMVTFLGLNLLFGHKPQAWMDVALLFLFYGLYFGVLGRDVAEYCTDKMAASIGYYTQEGIPTRQLESNVCAVCGNQLLVAVNEEGVIAVKYGLFERPYITIVRQVRARPSCGVQTVEGRHFNMTCGADARFSLPRYTSRYPLTSPSPTSVTPREGRARTRRTIPLVS